MAKPLLDLEEKQKPCECPIKSKIMKRTESGRIGVGIFDGEDLLTTYGDAPVYKPVKGGFQKSKEELKAVPADPYLVVQIDYDLWGKLKKAILPAVIRGDCRYALNGVCVGIERTGIRFTGTDTHRLHTVRYGGGDGWEELFEAIGNQWKLGSMNRNRNYGGFEFILPLDIVKKPRPGRYMLFAWNPHRPGLWAIEDHASATDTKIFEDHTIEATYPNFEEVIKDAEKKDGVEMPILQSHIDFVRRFNGMTHPETHAVKITGKPIGVRLDLNWDFEGVSCEAGGIWHDPGVDRDVVWTANRNYLEAALAANPETEMLTGRFPVDPNNPAIFKNKAYSALLMPIRPL